MKSTPLFELTGANSITAKQSGAPGTSSLLPRLIEYVRYYGITVLLIISLEASQQIFLVYDRIKIIHGAYTY